MLPDDLYHAQLHIHRNGKTTRHAAGRFMIKDGVLTHLESYHDGQLEQAIPAGPLTDQTVYRINAPGHDLSIASHHDIAHGHRLDFIPEHPLAQPLIPPRELPPEEIQQHLAKKPLPVWDYQRVGHDTPHTLEHHGGGKYSLDGNPLQDDEVQTVLGNIKSKTATLRYKKGGVADAIAKMESLFVSLRKEENMDPQAALAHLSGLHGDNPEAMKALSALRRHVFEDPMLNNGIGNKYAHQEWLKSPRPGVHIGLDLNGLKTLNDTQGHEAGDNAIKAFGHAMKGAMDDTVGDSGIHSHMARVGGDEFQAHLPTHEHASLFARNLRSRLEQVPAIGGVHNLSTSIGFGHDPASADKALYEAKKQKLGPTGPVHPSQMPAVLAHSLVPGFEGKVPTQHDELPNINMPANAKPTTPTLASPKLDTPKPAASPAVAH